MKKNLKKYIGSLLIALLLFSCTLTGSFAWQELSQKTLNEVHGTSSAPEIAVELQLCKQLPDGTNTDEPVSGAEYFLFRKGTEEGKPVQIGEKMVTDDEGKISLYLPAGDYYFEETYPPENYAHEKEGEAPKIQYAFTVRGDEKETAHIKAYNVPLFGTMTIETQMMNSDRTPLTKEEAKLPFKFQVDFSDGGTYPYRIEDGKEQLLKSGATISLRYGETAAFKDIPYGVTYSVRETPAKGFDLFFSDNHVATIGEKNCEALFTNIYHPELSDKPATLKITKKIVGEYPEKDKNKKFRFVMMTTEHQGNKKKIEPFTLKNGETKEFVLPAGTNYEVQEDDYAKDGYAQDTVIKGSGTAAGGEVTEIEVTNRYTRRIQTVIEGYEFWKIGEDGSKVMPKKITLKLNEDKDGRTVAHKRIGAASADKDGNWHYSFTAPKYDEEGNPIAYTVEEEPVDGFKATYSQGTAGSQNILNTYMTPVKFELPEIVKTVERTGKETAPETEFTFLLTGENGAPMPEGRKGNPQKITIKGSGKASAGTVKYENTGTYTYTLSEQNSRGAGWQYDDSVYKLMVTVTEQGEKLEAAVKIEKEGEPKDSVQFINRYQEEKELETLDKPDDQNTLEDPLNAEKITITGTKTWDHGGRPEEFWPKEVTVYLYAGDVLKCSQLVNKESDWKYSFTVPKNDREGKAINYRIGEAELTDYEGKVDGYNLKNIYRPPVSPENDGNGQGTIAQGEDQSKNGPTTGDTSRLRIWLTMFLVSLLILVITVRVHFRRERKTTEDSKVM